MILRVKWKAPPRSNARSLGTISLSICSREMLTLEYLSGLLEKHRAEAGVPVKEFAIGGRQFEFNSRPAIMGVINLSADSWYRESVSLSTDEAVRRGKVLREQG